MPQVVNPEPVAETGAAARWHEDGIPPVGQPHNAAARHGEHKLVGTLAIGGRRELVGDEPNLRDMACLPLSGLWIL